MNKERPYIEIRLVGTESSDPTPSDVGLFLNDVDSLYELARLALDPKYADFKFSRFALYRGGRPLRKEDRQFLEKLRHESPLDLQTLIGIDPQSVTAISTFIVMLTVLYKVGLDTKKLRADIELASLNAELTKENIENVKLDKRKKELEIGKLEREERIAQLKDSKILIGSGVAKELSLRDASEFIRTVERRLEKSPVRIKAVEAKVVDPIRKRQDVEGLHRWLEGEDEGEDDA